MLRSGGKNGKPSVNRVHGKGKNHGAAKKFEKYLANRSVIP
jgi:hypothetical protein